jgi:hypothetical protein
MIEKVGIRSIYGHRSFVYKIHLKQSFVFMRFDETPYYNSERYVVIVDSNKFYKEWTGKTVEYCVISDGWEQEKYNDAKVGFSEGLSDPVPLALIGYSDTISFVNGITRTKLLIRNGAVCFPVECSRKSAKKLYQNLSYKDTKIENVYRLLNRTSKIFKQNDVLG